LDLANSAATPGAEVPIPVFADVSNTALSQPSGQRAVGSLETSQKTSVPTISVTKPPAPLPVDLPTHDDFDPPSLDFELHSDDIESTGSLMREISHHSRSASELSNPSSSTAQKLAQKPPPGDAAPPPNRPSTSLSRVADLLRDSAPAFSASSTNLSPSTRPSSRPAPPPLLLPNEKTPLEGDESDSEGGELTATVRLVGSEGDVGLAGGQEQSDEASDGRAQAEVTSSAACSSDEASLPISRNPHRKRTSTHSRRGGRSAN